MNLNDMLGETKVEDAAISRSDLPDGTYAFKLKAKEDGTSPFKAFVREQSNARGGKIAEVGMYLFPSDANLSAKYNGVYIKAGLVGIVEGIGNDSGKEYKIDLGSNSSSVSALFKATGLVSGAPAIADAATGQPIDLDALQAAGPDNWKVPGAEVVLTRNGEAVNEHLFSTEFKATIKSGQYGTKATFNLS